MRSVVAFSAAALAFALAAPVLATPRVPRSALVDEPGTPAKPPSGSLPAYTPQDILSRLGLIVDFEKKLQSSAACADSGSACEFGGEIEVESGPGSSIVESDNTQEAIWIWSWHRSLTKNASYAPLVTSAFEYLALNPGWLEWQDGGGTGPDYYSFYNCGWGVRAVVELEAAAGDTSHHAYGDTCAQHIATNVKVAPTDPLIDAATAGWAASGLWEWAHAQGDAALEQKAVDIGAQVKAWIDTQPDRVGYKTWAVTGGAAFHGVVGSYMKAHPSELAAWVQSTAPKLGGWIDESQAQNPNDWTDWRNAFCAWNMLAQFDAAEALAEDSSGPHAKVALDILQKLWVQDGDGDGAMPGSQQRASADEDESWITAYFVYFGLRPAMEIPMADAGAGGDAGSGDDGGGGVGDDAGAGVDAGGAGAGAAPGGGGGGGCGCGSGGADASGAIVWIAIGAAAVAAARRKAGRAC